MYQSRVEQVADRLVLYCWYDKRTDNFDQVIGQALARHKLEPGRVTVICQPVDTCKGKCGPACKCNRDVT